MCYQCHNENVIIQYMIYDNIYTVYEPTLLHPLSKLITQTYVPSKSLRSASECRFIVHPKEAKNLFHKLFIKCSLLVEWPAQLNPSSWVLRHLQESAKNTSLPSLFDPLTLALSILILFLKKKKLLLLDWHSIHLLTACFYI